MTSALTRQRQHVGIAKSSLNKIFSQRTLRFLIRLSGLLNYHKEVLK